MSEQKLDKPEFEEFRVLVTFVLLNCNVLG